MNQHNELKALTSKIELRLKRRKWRANHQIASRRLKWDALFLWQPWSSSWSCFSAEKKGILQINQRCVLCCYLFWTSLVWTNACWHCIRCGLCGGLPIEWPLLNAETVLICPKMLEFLSHRIICSRWSFGKLTFLILKLFSWFIEL